jgi:molybdopterin converting factor small subunit
MVTVTFTAQLQRYVDCPRRQVEAATLAEALARVFEHSPLARGYILDDQGGLRQHVAVFIDGVRARDRRGLADALAPGAEVHVLQALTGG